MKIVDDRLHRTARRAYPVIASPNHGGDLRPEYLVMHYTAGRSAKESIQWLTHPASRASAHLVIARDGGITQLVPFDTVAWHAGRSAWEGRWGMNHHSIGIELANAGRLVRHGNRWRAWFGDEYDDSEVIEATHKHEFVAHGWHIYPAEQIEAALAVATLLVDHYELRDVIGHDDISPGRKSDPGPAFPMDSFRARLFGRAEDEPFRYRTTANLNIRSGAGTQYPTLPGSPLPEGKEVEVLAQQGSWRLVDVLDSVDGIMDLQGWVHGRYLERTT